MKILRPNVFLGYLLLNNIGFDGKITNLKYMNRNTPYIKFPKEGTNKYNLFEKHSNHCYEELEKSHFIKNFEDAINFQKEYAELGEFYEIIKCKLSKENIDESNNFESNEIFLGYDIADWNCESLLYDSAPSWEDKILNQSVHQGV